MGLINKIVVLTLYGVSLVYSNEKTYTVEKDSWGKHTIFEDAKSSSTWDEAEAVFHQIKSHPKSMIRVSHKRDLKL